MDNSSQQRLPDGKTNQLLLAWEETQRVTTENSLGELQPEGFVSTLSSRTQKKPKVSMKVQLQKKRQLTQEEEDALIDIAAEEVERFNMPQHLVSASRPKVNVVLARSRKSTAKAPLPDEISQTLYLHFIKQEMCVSSNGQAVKLTIFGLMRVINAKNIGKVLE